MAFLVAAAIGFTIMVPIGDVEAQDKAPNRAAESRAHQAVQYPRVGHQVRTLPQGHRTIRVNQQNYRYHNGSFYRRANNGVYVVVRAPIGARVGALPPGYVNFGIGPHRYFYANFTYFLWDRDRSEYIVVDEPEGAESALVMANETTSEEIFVYPNQGQSDEQRDRDRYECYLWASEQTDYDPGAGDPDIEKAKDYRRAQSACLEGRGYTVK
jgi:hypothetical protein